ncbi:site-specific DNA-methyltransferase [Pseudomonas sp. FSL R10-0056]|uniref:DNA methyltransferase n=1 Tax=Pseudomonas TaxID=286 RepID=UPI0013606C42|nr:site-specific DNA-methyltransferase [Pseudomonas sp. FSL R10-0056]MQT68460.1 site-specific DNA-methyltransferase [Pseudomonas sp. FSL R10-0071]MQU48053.1 site-specific DNA-methyltransferase [Pseudomonas sp. FSL A6-1183]
MSKNTPAQDSLQLTTIDGGTTNVEKYKFEPIKGYPMLNWRGKRPFTSTQYYPAQLKEVHGEEVDGWRNKIFWGDNLQVMSHLLKEFRGEVDLIYIDPPFDSKIEYKKTIKVNRQSAETGYTAFEEKQYTDVWTNDEYLQFIYERAILMRELLSDDGVFCLHCDWHKSHYLRALLDEVFGAGAFQNEIVWHYYNKMQGNINRFASDHDIILVYSKSGKFQFNKLREKREKPVQQIKRVWDKATQSLVNAKDENGKVVYINSTHRTIDDVWRLPMLQPADRVEVVGYPTQKPETLLERIILAYSNPGDIVFDCFMGSGTTQAVSSKYGRRYIGNDINLASVQTTSKRLLGIHEEMADDKYQPTIKNGLRGGSDFQASIEEEGDDAAADWTAVFKVQKVYPGFEVHTVNNYDIFRNPIQAKELLIEALEVQKLEFSTVFDGEKDGRMIKIMPVNRIATRADLNELIAGFDYKSWERKQNEKSNPTVEKITLVCMGHESDLAAQLELAARPFKIDVEVVDILRDKADLEFKRDSQAKVCIKKGELVIERFYPMSLLQKLSLQKESVEDWKELVESVLIDWNYDGAVLQPTVVDIPGKNDLVKGAYKVPQDAGTVRVKITDLLSESWEGSVINGD